MSATLDLIDGVVDVVDGAVRSAEARVDAASYSSPNAKRNAHVVAPDFLDAADHPDISLHASRVEPAAGGHTVDGQLTVKGSSFPIRLAVDEVAIAEASATFRATAHVDRKAIGVDKLPTFVIGRVLDLTVDAQAQLVGTEDEGGAE